VALPSSQVPPLETCPALRPRWCLAHSPKRTQDCCLPVTGNRRLSPRYELEGYPLDHDYTHFGAQSRGLRPRYTRLRTAPYGEARGFATDRLARRSSGGIGAYQARTHWVTTTNFMGLLPIPRFWAYLGATSAWLGAVVVDQIFGGHVELDVATTLASRCREGRWRRLLAQLALWAK